MAMAVDNRHQLSGLPYEQMRYQGPQFTNPWVATSGAPPGGQMYVPSMAQAAAAHQQPHHHSAATAAAAAMPYQNSSLPSLAVPPGAQQADPSLFYGHDSQMQGYARQYAADYPPSAAASSSSSAAAAANYTTATAGSSYAGSEYAATAHAQQQQQQPQQHKLSPYPTFQDRRASHPSVASNMFLGTPIEAARFRQSSLIDSNDRLHAATEAERSSFNDALDASRGMVAMSQDITPRNIYGHNGSTRSSTDSYGFPSTHSSHSSISSASTHPSTYYGSSVSEASYGDYSSANESVDMPSRALPRSGMAALPPNPSSMMGQFSSKVSSSSQKKHKCKVCDKRFTRPSSLQTHMYSHTGEKPFACDVDGCGRHFSVVSNLRRHKKVHKADGDHASPDDE